jgi:hypothetical protein
MIASRYESAEKITLVMDNLNTLNPGSLYEAFSPEKAKALWILSSLYSLRSTEVGSTWLKLNSVL